MYRVSPFTYLIEGLLGQAIGGYDINCAPVELVQLTPPSGQTCSQYMQPYINSNGGYLTNSDASSGCNYCQYRTTDEFLLNSFNISYSHHWRNFGFMWVFIAFNVSRLRLPALLQMTNFNCRSLRSTRSRGSSACAVEASSAGCEESLHASVRLRRASDFDVSLTTCTSFIYNGHDRT